MKVLVAAGEYEQTLNAWRGSAAKIWMYHVSLKRLVIHIYRAGVAEALYVVAVGCARIAGPFAWKPAELSIRAAPTGDGRTRTVVADTQAGFELVCADASLVVGPQEVPLDPFESFFGDLR